jgi:LysM repeat protein
LEVTAHYWDKYQKARAEILKQPKEETVAATDANSSGLNCVKKVKAGDTLWSIAQSEKCSVKELTRLNPGIDPNSLKIGQEIKLPSSSKSEDRGRDTKGKGCAII